MQATACAFLGRAIAPRDQLKVPFSKGMPTKLKYEIAPKESCLELRKNIWSRLFSMKYVETFLQYSEQPEK